MTRAPVLTSDDFLAAALELLPEGPAWSREPGSTLSQFWGAIADRLAGLQRRSRQLLEDEGDPSTASETLPDWERAFGLPDACSPNTSFSRASVATYLDGTGVLRTAEVDRLRYSFDQTTGANLGPLIENAGTNLQVSSGVIVPGGGYSIGGNTVDGGAIDGPDGLSNARRVVSNSGTGANVYLSRTGVLAVSPSTTYSFSGYFRRGAGVADSGTLLTVDERNGAAVVTRTTGPGIVSSALGTAYKRVSTTLTTRADTVSVQVYWTEGFKTGVSVDVACVQIEANAAPSSFIYTSGAAATRAADLYFERTLAARQAALVARIGGAGGQSRAYYIAVAAALGFTITIEEFRPFRADRSTGDDPLNNNPWPFRWRVHAPAQSTKFFRADRSTAGERLSAAENQVLECVLGELAPGHTEVLFVYGS